MTYSFQSFAFPRDAFLSFHLVASPRPHKLSSLFFLHFSRSFNFLTSVCPNFRSVHNSSFSISLLSVFLNVLPSSFHILPFNLYADCIIQESRERERRHAVSFAFLSLYFRIRGFVDLLPTFQSFLASMI